MKKKSIAIIGCGSSALMFAAKIDTHKFDVVIYEKNNAPARKFLVAGDGGFNLTHSEDLTEFIKRYTPPNFLNNSLCQFSNTDLINFLETLGIKTYTGTSKRVFPIKGIKPIDVLNAFLNHIKSKNIAIKTKHEWKGWNDKNELIIQHNNSISFIKTDYTIFSLGGASWKKTGSEGNWQELFNKKNIQTIAFQASNCAYKVKWPNEFISKHEGQSLKNIEIFCDQSSKKGEVVITKFGIEGGVIYALSPQIRMQLNNINKADVYIDLKPIFSVEEIEQKLLSSPGNKSLGTHLKNQLKFNSIEIDLIKLYTSKSEFHDFKLLSKKIKQLPISIVDFAPIDEAISTVGGIALSELNENYEFNKLKNNFAIGEMLNWDAPTGGYLLQGCFSMGAYLANYFNQLSTFSNKR